MRKYQNQQKKKKKYKSRTQYKLIHHDENNEAFLQLYKEIHR